MKKNIKKLKLNKLTVSNLTNDEANQKLGGGSWKCGSKNYTKVEWSCVGPGKQCP
ncbi:MAG: hypothetical protein ABIO98_09250 [Chitinophagales bacterium]